jgi:hypothetical protein
VTFEVLPPKTAQDRAAELASLAEDGGRDALRSIGQRARSNDAVRMVLERIDLSAPGRAKLTYSTPIGISREQARGLPFDDSVIVEEDS